MGRIYTFQPLDLPYLSDYLALSNNTDELPISVLSTNNLANFQYVQEHGLFVAKSYYSGGDAITNIYRFAVNGIVYGGCYRENNSGTNPYLYHWEFAVTTGAQRCQYNISTSSTYNSWHLTSLTGSNYGFESDIDTYDSMEELLADIESYRRTQYPITYHYANSTVSGPSSAAVGDTIIVSAVPDVDYSITDASTQILVTNDDIAIPYTWDAMNNRITFTMPQPAENRGGFGSTRQ